MKIFIDFDNTLVNSNKSFISILNKKYSLNKTEDDLKDYNYQSIYPITQKEKKQIFESKEFFNNLTFKTDVLEFINKFRKTCEIVICSVGTEENIQKKSDFLHNYLPEISFFGLIDAKDKSAIDMQRCIHIDDNPTNLNTNAALKILYKDFYNYHWQENIQNTNYYVTNTWNEIDSILDFYIKNIDLMEV